jgi:hypothetical protein
MHANFLTRGGSSVRSGLRDAVEHGARATLITT